MFFDGSTKLGATDDYLPWDQLKSLSGESTELLNEIEIQTRRIGQYALKKGSTLGLLINDFKTRMGTQSKWRTYVGRCASRNG